MSVKMVLGVSMSSHDRSAAVIKDGKVVAAIAEERLDRRKRSEGFYAGKHSTVLPPFAAIRSVLNQTGLRLSDIDVVACSRSIGSAKETLAKYLAVDEDRILEPPLPCHHLAHAHAAFFTSPFKKAAVLVLDEQGSLMPSGQYECASWYTGDSSGLSTVQQCFGTVNNLSLGLFYNVFAGVLGLSEAGLPSPGKLMALASLGRKSQNNVRLIELLDDGCFHIDLGALTEFFDSRLDSTKQTPTSVDDLIDRYSPISWSSEEAIELASVAQQELERTILHVSSALYRRTGMSKLCFGGGVALNCLANRRLYEAGFDDVFIHPAATDDGNAIGIALWAYTSSGGRRKSTPRWSPFLGSTYSDNEYRSAIEKFGLPYSSRPPATAAAEAIAANQIVCWIQGRSEWGPRSLGARSIFAAATSPGITAVLNKMIKHRESFRPFAVSWTTEAARAELQRGTRLASLEPYMLTVGYLKSNAKCQVRHVDDTVRYQIVDPTLQPKLYALLQQVGELTGLEAVLNTSFNAVGEPIVETPFDAVRMFLISGADMLIMGDYVVNRHQIDPILFRKALVIAWSETSTKPEEVAVRMAINGYLVEAEGFASEHQVLDKVMHRFGRFSGNLDDAQRQAIKSLESAALEPMGRRALAILFELNQGEAESLVLAAANILAQPGGIWAVANRIGVASGKD